MASKKLISTNSKQSFGKHKKGKAKKNSGPKDKTVNKYRGQGK